MITIALLLVTVGISEAALGRGAVMPTDSVADGVNSRAFNTTSCPRPTLARRWEREAFRCQI